MIDYLTNIYIISLIGSLLGLLLTYLYDKFEKKEYSSKVYFKVFMLTYIASLVTLYVFNLVNNNNVVSPKSVSVNTPPNTSISVNKTELVGGAQVNNTVPTNVSKPFSLESQQFNTGTPTF